MPQPQIRERRRVAKELVALGRPSDALRVLRNRPDPLLGPQTAKRILDAFEAGGFMEARIDIRPFDFEPFGPGLNLRHIRDEVRRHRDVKLDKRGDQGVWLVSTKPDLSDGWVI